MNIYIIENFFPMMNNQISIYESLQRKKNSLCNALFSQAKYKNKNVNIEKVR